MARSSYRLDMKRDDPRTLMLKMDARLTYAGRERNHAFRLEADREIRHLDYARHLTQATFDRQQKEMRKKMDFLKNLVEENRARREKLQEEEKGMLSSNREENHRPDLRHSLPMLPVRRNLQELYKPELIGSVRRTQNGGTHGSRVSRSLNDLNDTYTRHRAQESLNEKRLRQLRQEMKNAKKKAVPKVDVTKDDTTPSDSPKVVWASAAGMAAVTNKSESQGGVSTQTISLPEIANNNKTVEPVSSLRRVSLSKMIASGEITKLPGISGNNAVTTGTPQSVNMARSFYMNTSQTSGRGPKLQPIQQKQDNVDKRGWVKLPPNVLPLKFLQDDIEQNPFMKPDFKPDTYRSRQLLDSQKPEEMYVWLGFDSEEEFKQMVQQAKEEVDAESDGNSSNGDVVELDVIEEVAEDDINDGSIEKEGQEYLRKRRMSRRVSRLSAPVAMLASSLNQEIHSSGKRKPSSALKKFIKAAKTIFVVRQFQMNNEDDTKK